MELLLVRKYLKAAYTIGCLWVGGTRFCDTLEAIPSGCYEVSSYALYVVESLEVIVATVEDIERTFFVGNHIHRIHVVHSGFSYVKECRNRSLNVTERIL